MLGLDCLCWSLCEAIVTLTLVCSLFNSTTSAARSKQREKTQRSFGTILIASSALVEFTTARKNMPRYPNCSGRPQLTSAYCSSAMLWCTLTKFTGFLLMPSQSISNYSLSLKTRWCQATPRMPGGFCSRRCQKPLWKWQVMATLTHLQSQIQNLSLPKPEIPPAQSPTLIQVMATIILVSQFPVDH